MDKPEYQPPWRMLGSMRLGQCLINALIDNGNLKQLDITPQLVEDDQGNKRVTAPALRYEVVGQDPFYMEDRELLKVVRDYLVKLERQDAERKANQKATDRVNQILGYPRTYAVRPL